MAHRFLITDPCYVMDRQGYLAICDEKRTDTDPDPFETKPVPFETPWEDDAGVKIKFHTIRCTPNGDGFWIRRVRLIDRGTTRDDDVAVDAGMLCVVEHPTGWPEKEPGGVESFSGARYHTLRAALAAFPGVLRRF